MNGPDGRKFVWGRIKRTLVVGPYSVVQYHDKMDDAERFHPYLYDRDLCVAFQTLDGALVYAIAKNHTDDAAGAARFFLRGIGAEPR